MATVMELIGLSPLGTAAVPQVDARKHGVAARCGRLVLDLVKNNLRPRDIVTRKAIDNAIGKASNTLRNLGWFEVVQMRGDIKDGKVNRYQVTLKIGFTLE